MKRLVLHVALMLVTFAFGVGLDRLLWEPRVEPLPNLEVVKLPPSEPQRVPVATVAPPAPAATPIPNLIRDYDSNKFSRWGVFYIMGTKTKAFADFDTIEVALSGDGDDYPGYISVTTRSNTNGYGYDVASATFALVTEQRLFFATEKIRETEFTYTFDGEFLRKDFASLGGKNKAVLRGTLTKMKNGRSVAQKTFSFRMEHLGC